MLTIIELEVIIVLVLQTVRTFIKLILFLEKYQFSLLSKKLLT